MATDSPAPPASPSPHAHVVFTDLDGNEGVLVDLDTKQYFQLNTTASFVWRGLAAGTPADGIAREMTAVYDVTLEHAQASVDAAIRDFIALRLVRAPR
jgi:hypothetical protein